MEVVVLVVVEGIRVELERNRSLHPRLRITDRFALIVSHNLPNDSISLSENYRIQ